MSRNVVTVSVVSVLGTVCVPVGSSVSSPVDISIVVAGDGGGGTSRIVGGDVDGVLGG